MMGLGLAPKALRRWSLTHFVCADSINQRVDAIIFGRKSNAADDGIS
jgi:hypothetical protein